jgi:hypothetical protein
MSSLYGCKRVSVIASVCLIDRRTGWGFGRGSNEAAQLTATVTQFQVRRKLLHTLAGHFRESDLSNLRRYSVCTRGVQPSLLQYSVHASKALKLGANRSCSFPAVEIFLHETFRE